MTRRAKPIACPSCGSFYSLVKDCGDPMVRQRARKNWRGTGIWRLRECQDCGVQFTTSETVTGVYSRESATS